jgi:predicted deacylase
MADTLSIAGTTVPPGSRMTVSIPVARLYTHAEMTMPVHVLRGSRDGPRLFLTAAIHGDEIIGVEIIRRLLKMKALGRLQGTLMAVPVVNVYGFIHHSRYLPDRRDLNRFFPGAENGSLTSRLAHILMNEIVANSTHGIDLHAGSHHRVNLPQIRACIEDPETRRLALAFGAPVVLDANIREGTLRQAVASEKIPMLLYEAGEALRFDEMAVRTGVRGILTVMRAIGMLPGAAARQGTTRSRIASSTGWVRAPISGILGRAAKLGQGVGAGAVIGEIADPFGENDIEVVAPDAGIVIGRTNLPLAHRGDALFHIASFDNAVHFNDALVGAKAIIPHPDEPAPW